MPACPVCHQDFSDALEDCPECAGEGVTVRCGACGEEYPEGDACPSCGRARTEFTCEAHSAVAATGRCVICGRAVCKECRRGEGRAVLCEAHRSIPVIQGWAQVYSTASEFEAQLLCDNLLAEEIDARIFSQKDNMLSVDLGELSIVRILVPAWEYERASEVMRGHMDEEGEVAFACPACGEAYEPGAQSCSACGADLAAQSTD